MGTVCCFPDQLFPNLDKFPSLRELSVRLDGSPDVLSVIPGDLPNLHHMEKLSIQTSTESDLSKLGKDGAWISQVMVQLEKYLANNVRIIKSSLVKTSVGLTAWTVSMGRCRNRKRADMYL